MSGKKVYKMYRSSTIGSVLYDTLDILCSNGIMPQSLAMKVLEEFDRAISAALAKSGGKVAISGKLSSYRCCEFVWTFYLKSISVEVNSLEKFSIDRMKIVCCAARNSNS